MKKILIPLFLITIISSCKKQTEDTVIKNNIEEKLSAPVPPGNYWTFRLNVPGFYGQRRLGATCFVIDNKAYVYGGSPGNGDSKKDLWVYDPVANTFTQKASLPASAQPSSHSVSFSINGKGYVATGSFAVGNSADASNELWEYNPKLNSWLQKASMPTALGRWRAVGFSINGKGYVGTGRPFNASLLNLKDMWEYDPVTNSWLQKADMPTTGGRVDAFVFLFNNKAYIGSGAYDNSMFEFDPSVGTIGAWSPKASYPGEANNLVAAFATNLAGFAGTGGKSNDGSFYKKDFWRYSPSTNSWTKKTDFPGFPRYSAIAFSINGIGYMGLGYNHNPRANMRDIYKYVQ